MYYCICIKFADEWFKRNIFAIYSCQSSCKHVEYRKKILRRTFGSREHNVYVNTRQMSIRNSIALE